MKKNAAAAETSSVSGSAALAGNVKQHRADAGLGIGLVVLATFIFAWQDAITKTLVQYYPISFIVMVRGWIFLLAGLLLIAMAKGGIRVHIKTKKPVLQILRGLLVTSQWLLAGFGLHYLGLAESTALYEAYPLFGTVLAVFILREDIGWRRVCGLIIGFAGILVMVRPGAGAVSGGAFYALAGALFFAIYMVITRLVAAYDEPQTSFFYMGAVPACVMSLGLPYLWVGAAPQHIWLFLLLGILAVSAHFCMIKALSLAPVGILQPFNYFQLIWSVLVGFLVFGAMPDRYTYIGAALVAASGLFVLYRGQIRKPQIFVRRGGRKI